MLNIALMAKYGQELNEELIEWLKEKGYLDKNLETLKIQANFIKDNTLKKIKEFKD